MIKLQNSELASFDVNLAKFGATLVSDGKVDVTLNLDLTLDRTLDRAGRAGGRPSVCSRRGDSAAAVTVTSDCCVTDAPDSGTAAVPQRKSVFSNRSLYLDSIYSRPVNRF